ncbi:SRPBCC family protein [Phytoactinopolyspora mesophila]|uniref:Polyketide cyclase n=1 Tax=Phytoactinopolyspora mesophila TaxID=2650750 RepID=A0A7K3M9L0_9ACTN|nr:SRPBCC family protein [Phytoactinopolyspora mesophila]NDL60031.1 polyketide cyclase [Phytoactinopolyspora mesophila]
MPVRSVEHATFVVTRTYDASPARVFEAFADPEIKLRWFAAPDDVGLPEVEFDFRVGGREYRRGGPKEGPMHTFEARYWEIIPEERIVYSYDMHLDDTRISVSLATVELRPQGSGTMLVFTEQGAFLDGHDNVGGREQGTAELLDALGVELTHQLDEGK